MAESLRLIDIEPIHRELLTELHRQGFAGNEHLAIGNVVTLSNTPGLIGLLALMGNDAKGRGGEPAGFVLLRVAADELEILTIVVNPKFRRTGVAKKLLDAGFQRGALSGAKAVFLEVAEDNVAACTLYRDMGFIEVGKRRHYYGQGRHAEVLKLDLPGNLPAT